MNSVTRQYDLPDFLEPQPGLLAAIDDARGTILDVQRDLFEMTLCDDYRSSVVETDQAQEMEADSENPPNIKKEIAQAKELYQDDAEGLERALRIIELRQQMAESGFFRHVLPSTTQSAVASAALRCIVGDNPEEKHHKIWQSASKKLDTYEGIETPVPPLLDDEARKKLRQEIMTKYGFVEGAMKSKDALLVSIAVLCATARTADIEDRFEKAIQKGFFRKFAEAEPVLDSMRLNHYDESVLTIEGFSRIPFGSGIETGKHYRPTLEPCVGFAVYSTANLLDYYGFKMTITQQAVDLLNRDEEESVLDEKARRLERVTHTDIETIDLEIEPDYRKIEDFDNDADTDPLWIQWLDGAMAKRFGDDWLTESARGSGTIREFVAIDDLQIRPQQAHEWSVINNQRVVAAMAPRMPIGSSAIFLRLKRPDTRP